MADLLAAESAEREVRSVSYQMKAARFPAHCDLAGFDFSQSRVDEALISRLHTRQFLESAQNVVLIGGRAQARRTWPLPSASKPFSIWANGYASSRRWSW